MCLISMRPTATSPVKPRSPVHPGHEAIGVVAAVGIPGVAVPGATSSRGAVALLGVWSFTSAA